MNAKQIFAIVATAAATSTYAGPKVSADDLKLPECAKARVAFATQASLATSLGLVPQTAKTVADERATKDELPRFEAAVFAACGVKPSDAIRIERAALKEKAKP